jgi:hypothetical protein
VSAPADRTATRRAPTATRLAVLLLVVAAVGWLGFRAVRAFDVDRHRAEAAAVLAATDAVSHRLPPVPGGRAAPPPQDGGAPEREGSPQPGGVPDAVHTPGATGAQPGGVGAPVHTPGATGPGPTGAEGRLSYRPGTWLTVVDLEGLDPVAGDERYMVFLRNWAGWTLAGAARPDPDGAAQIRSAAEPRPLTIYEVVVTRAVDDATSVPHGRPVLHWFDGSIAPPRARPFDFARGA